jgi:hypothetical protein
MDALLGNIVEKLAEAKEALESIDKANEILAKLGYHLTITQQEQPTTPPYDITSAPIFRTKEERQRTKAVVDLIKASPTGEVSYREVAIKLKITESAAKVWLGRKAKADFPFTFGRNQS